MTQVIIDDIIPRTQLVAAAGQTVFNTNWTVNATTDVVVYARADGVEADDETQVVSTSDYNVTLIGGSQTVRVTFLVGRTLDDVITIVRNTPSERLNLYINTNFVPSMLNNDFGILTLVDQQSQMYDTVINPRYNVSATIEPDSMIGGGDIVLPILPPGFGWRKNEAGTAIEAIAIPGGGFSPADATYLLQVSNINLPNAQAMGELDSGFVVNTSTTGVQLSRVLLGVNLQTVVTNGDGISGNPIIGISPNPVIPGTGAMIPPKGSTAQRPSIPVEGEFRFNTSLSAMEIFAGGIWDQVGGGVVDTITGTVNQIIVDSTDPQNPILSTPQDIDQNANVQFDSVQFNSTNSVYDENGVLLLSLFGVASAVNYMRFENAITGFGPVIQALGSDTNIDIRYFAKGAGFHNFASTGNVPVHFRSGTAYQHATLFSFANTSATRTATWQDSDGTVAWLTDIPPASGLTWSTIAGTSQAASVNNGYVSGNAGLTTVTLPATAAVGDVVAVEGLGAAGWVLAANTGQTIKIGSATTSSAGSLASVAASDNIYVTCIVANTTWRVRTTNSAGLTIA